MRQIFASLAWKVVLSHIYNVLFSQNMRLPLSWIFIWQLSLFLCNTFKKVQIFLTQKKWELGSLWWYTDVHVEPFPVDQEKSTWCLYHFFLTMVLCWHPLLELYLQYFILTKKFYIKKKTITTHMYCILIAIILVLQLHSSHFPVLW